MEGKLKVIFPSEFKNRMSKNNGGELLNNSFQIELISFFDRSNRKRISRTCNHIEKETLITRK